MIDPDGLLDHAEKLANAERGRPPDVDLRRGISAAYYAVYHELTGQAASHLVVVANDAALVDSLQSFNDMQELRHEADYDHGRRFSRLHLVEACDSARLARRRLGDASSAAREALFTLLTVRRADFRQR